MDISVSTNLEGVGAEIDNIIEGVVQGIYDGVEEMGERTAASIRTEATFLDFTGETRNSITFTRIGEGQGYVSVASSGVLLSTMRDHVVMVSKERPQLVAWGMQAQSPEIRGRAAAVALGVADRFPLYVRQNPFIQRGYNTVEGEYPQILQRTIAERLSN